jgi:hypothetical protein
MSLPPYVLKSHESFTYVSPDVFLASSKSLVINALYGIVRVSFSAQSNQKDAFQTTLGGFFVAFSCVKGNLKKSLTQERIADSCPKEAGKKT